MAAPDTRVADSPSNRDVVLVGLLAVVAIGGIILIALGYQVYALVIGALTGINIGAIIFGGRVQRAAYAAGYWGGRNDETTVHVAQQLSEYESQEAALRETQQMVAQQVARRMMEVPRGWPAWDGVDRLAFTIPEELQPVLLDDDPEPAFLRPFRWPWQR